MASVMQDENGVKVIVRGPGGMETLSADRAICTLPCPVIGKIFDDARLSAPKQRAIREQNYSRTVKVFQSRTRFWQKQGLSGIASTDLPIERITPDPGLDQDDRGALAAYPIGGYTASLERMSEEERVRAAFDQARQIFPELAQSFEGGVAHCWGLQPWQQGSFALHNPGQIGFLNTLGKAEGRVHFAGEHTSAWAGWMQGAPQSPPAVSCGKLTGSGCGAMTSGCPLRAAGYDSIRGGEAAPQSHSHLSADIASSRLARLAGTKPASTANATNNSTAPENAGRSSGSTP